MNHDLCHRHQHRSRTLYEILDLIDSLFFCQLFPIPDTEVNENLICGSSDNETVKVIISSFVP